MTLFWIIGIFLYCGTATASFINRDGTVTTLDLHPYIVQVEIVNDSREWLTFCSASILTARFLLSAARCCSDPILIQEHIRIRAATEIINSFGRIIYIEKIVNHPDYCKKTKRNDISMLKLTKALTSERWIQQATVVNYGTKIPDNLPVDLIGWGKIDKELRNLTVHTINNKVCAQQLQKSGFNVTEKMICTKVLAPGGHSCPYQIGGPVFYKRVLIGIASECNWNYVGNGTQTPLVSTSVTSFTNWIIETTRLEITTNKTII